VENLDFYISWSHSDAVFCNYFDRCPMLISAIPDNKNAFKKFKKFPGKLIIDSGALYYSKQSSKSYLRNIFELQRYIIDSTPTNLQINIVHLDEPLLNKNTLSKKYEAVERTLFNANEHMNLFKREGFSENISIMGVIQGYDFPSIHYSIYELKKMGYTHFGIGSMLSRNANDQIDYMNYLSQSLSPENLHVFGVTGIPQMKVMSELNIKSFDSSRPTMVAAFFQVMYSNPFRTYLISGSKVGRTQPILEKPLPCSCPVCLENPEDIMKMSHRKYMKLRSIHNYYHLMKAIDQIKQKRGVV
jgi:7-cyano-7-deazaguanine tRNA-ribosyltransferase